MFGITASTSSALVGVLVLVVGLGGHEFGNGGNEELDLRYNGGELSVFSFGGLAHVCEGFVVGYGGASNLGNVVLDFVAILSHVVGAVVVVALSRTASAVLCVCVMQFDKCFKVVLCQIVVHLGGAVLLFPLHHLRLVKEVEVIHLLQVELELVLVRDGDIGVHEGGLGAHASPMVQSRRP